MSAGSFIVALLAFVALGCSKRHSGAPAPPASQASAAVSATASGPLRVPPSSSRAALAEPAVRALVADWLAAQNGGRFADYERLYASRFTGIKRSGTRQVHFDRDGWMRDRKGMFGQPMQVEATGLAISLTRDVAVVTLRQTWASGDYRDVGPKQLVVVATPDGPRIAREELLSSEMVTPPRATSETLHLLTPEGMVLGGAEEAWSFGPSRPGSRENVALRAVEEQRLPAELRAWKGRAVHTVAAGGSTCETTVSGFALRAEVVPHFGSVQSWHGEAETPALTPAQIAEEIWTLSFQGGRVLIAELSKRCDGLWALDARSAAPLAVAPEPASPSLEADALGALRALPDYAKIQADFSSQPGARGLWDEYGDHERRVFGFRKGQQLALVGIVARAGNGCGDFEGRLGALFSLQPGSKRALEFVVTTPPRQAPSSAFDLDGDGSLEVLFGSARESDSAWLFHRTRQGPTLAELFSVPFLDCGC